MRTLSAHLSEFCFVGSLPLDVLHPPQGQEGGHPLQWPRTPGRKGALVVPEQFHCEMKGCTGHIYSAKVILCQFTDIKGTTPGMLKSGFIISNGTFTFALKNVNIFEQFWLKDLTQELCAVRKTRSRSWKAVTQQYFCNTPWQSVLLVWKIFRVGPVLILRDGAASATMGWDLSGGFYAKNGCYKKSGRKKTLHTI